MKIESRYIYFSIDKYGFYLEIGSLEKPTSIFTVALMRNWWKEEKVKK